MKLERTHEFLLLGAILIAGFVSVYALSDRLVTAKPQLPAGYEDEDLSLQGARLKGYALGFEGLIADWYWMRSLQYIGKKFIDNSDKTIRLDDLSDLNPRLLYPMLDNASTLDPKFMALYNYGAMVLPAIDDEEAIAIVKKGIENNPKEWRLYHYLGFIYWQLERFEEAADTYEKGAAIEDAAPFMTLMAARMRGDAGSLDTARAIYRQVYDQAEDSQTKENARLRLLQVDFFEERDAIRKALTEFRKANGRCPSRWSDVIPLLVDTTLPSGRELRANENGALVDPSDAPYLLTDKDGNCDLGLDRESTRIPLR
ncbi:MAG: hypothetical protein DWQ47_16875 [Acidobacteria bacterium]|nr:MAG: hypothetical protein DWQ32_04275 [Acidobacteriota bacterium]REK02283.1 MAG: hypothetical protein DWQ38_07875 [Acidobacteriota bacterium]REK13914.1 MAG: hypothetical protein DWQ43_09965 [Acidobacteriota bacterium]REK41908.1 MAG: hypothetical protein DWQ47_16875 [Acidobacteriota bacterium]